MSIKFRILKSFFKDLKRIKDRKLLSKVEKVTNEVNKNVKDIENLDEISIKIKNSKKLKNADNSYRIKVDDYRIGAEVDEVENKSFFSFKRFLHRKDIYKKFPKKN